jgi:hypothetical protein
MSGFTVQPLHAMTWTRNSLGAEVTRLYTKGAVLSVIRGQAGDFVPAHGYTHGCVTYVVSGAIEIDGNVLRPGDAGTYQAHSGFFSVKFLEDSIYVVARNADDELTVPDSGEMAAAHLDA